MKILLASIIFLYSCSLNKKAEKYDIVSETLPGCIIKIADTLSMEKDRNPPAKIFSFTYKGKTVYYIPAKCCDFYSDLYNDSCVLIGHPDGGFTGRGDGSVSDFIETRTDEKLVWEQRAK